MKRIQIEFVMRLRQFIDDEARSCSMDFGCITPEYVFRMWGGSVPIEDIALGLKVIKNEQRLLQ